MSAVLIVAFAAILSLSAPAPAHAITRAKILKRANHWVHKRVRYSQRSYYRGYRRDCSGFVSMAWGLKKSYTTRTISKRARRIRISSLRPGDAVLTRGHVSIFGGWKSKRKHTYYALEETTWGSHAKKHVRKIPHHAKALRRKGLTKPRRRVAPVRRPIVIPPTPSPSTQPTVSVPTSGTAQALTGSQPVALALTAPVLWDSKNPHPLFASLAVNTMLRPSFAL